MKTKPFKKPIYLFHIPIFYRTISCYECGRTEWNVRWKGVILLGYKEVQIQVTEISEIVKALTKYHNKLLLQSAEAWRRQEVIYSKTPLRFKRYGDLGGKDGK